MLANPDQLLLRIPVVLLAMTVHEYAHGWAAWQRGDSTAKNAGRLTLNPAVHIDIFGLLMLMFGPFGWAKPVPVNPYNLDNPRKDMLYVSAAGPVSNILCAMLFGYSFRIMHAFGLTAPLHHYIIDFFLLSVLINLGLSFFNLLPVPPLDGSKIVLSLLPPSKGVSYLGVIRHAPKIFLVMIVVEWGLHIPVFSILIHPLWKPYAAFWQMVIFGGKAL